MDFIDKYISQAENEIKPNASKVLLSNDAYAIGEMIHALILKIEQVRLDK